jgi:hypothetical protein
MRQPNNKQRIFIALYLIAHMAIQGCGKRNFYQDPNNPGLSLLTSRGYDIMSTYINEIPYVNTYQTSLLTGAISNSLVSIMKIHTSAISDTLSIFWPIQPGEPSNIGSVFDYPFLNILIPVPKDFSASDFLAWNGTRFTPDSGTGVTVRLNSDYPPSPSIGGVYFVQIVPVAGDTSGDYYFSGIFEGQIGNSISITKGRFDCMIALSQIQF